MGFMETIAVARRDDVEMMAKCPNSRMTRKGTCNARGYSERPLPNP